MQRLNYANQTFTFTEDQIDDLLEKGWLECFEGSIVPNIKEPETPRLSEEEKKMVEKEWEKLSWEDIPLYENKVIDSEGDFGSMAGALKETVQVGTKTVKCFENNEFHEFESFCEYRRVQKKASEKKKEWEKEKQKWVQEMNLYIDKSATSLPFGFQEKQSIKREIEQMLGYSLDGVIAWDGEEIVYIFDGTKIFAGNSEELASKLS